MVRVIKASPQGKGRRIGVIVSRFNLNITKRLLDGCLKALLANGVKDSGIDVVWVPGAVEIPSACLWMARQRRYDALVALGAIVRGETAHFEVVSLIASRGISEVSLESGLPIGFGVLTTENTAQAMARSGSKDNKGEEAALVALEMSHLKAMIRR